MPPTWIALYSRFYQRKKEITMGRNSGSNRGTKDGGGDFKGKITNVGPLVEMTDPQMYKATKQAISRYHAVLGVRQREVKLATFRGLMVFTLLPMVHQRLFISTVHISIKAQSLLVGRTPTITQAAGVRAQTNLLRILLHMSWHTLHGMNTSQEQIKGRPAKKYVLSIVHG